MKIKIKTVKIRTYTNYLHIKGSETWSLKMIDWITHSKFHLIIDEILLMIFSLLIKMVNSAKIPQFSRQTIEKWKNKN